MANTANAEWKGDLKGGRGHFEIADGRLAGDYSFKSRFEGENDAGANPEELIAAAHASCFSMALSNILAEHGHEPESVKTTADVTLKVGSDGPKITKIALRTVGKVPGIDAEHFAKHAEEAKEGCPVSQALAAVEEITLETEFDG
jgi:osmotically inducible protein OsmC